MAESFIGEPQAVHAGPWFCVSSMCQPPVRRPEFASKPSHHGSRFHRVAGNEFVLYGGALRAFEQPMLKADWTRIDARKHHARRTVRTTRALDGCERWAGGKISLWHDTSLLGGSVQHSLSPMVADRGGGDGTSMRPRVPELLVNIAHSLKLNKSSGFASDWAACVAPADRRAARHRQGRRSMVVMMGPRRFEATTERRWAAVAAQMKEAAN
jgi:hypothetical protein